MENVVKKIRGKSLVCAAFSQGKRSNERSCVFGGETDKKKHLSMAKQQYDGNQSSAPFCRVSRSIWRSLSSLLFPSSPLMFCTFRPSSSHRKERQRGMRPMERDERGQTGSTHVSGSSYSFALRLSPLKMILGVCKMKVEAVKSIVIPDES